MTIISFSPRYVILKETVSIWINHMKCDIWNKCRMLLFSDNQIGLKKCLKYFYPDCQNVFLVHLFFWLKIHLPTLVSVTLQRSDLNYLSAPPWWVDISQTLCPLTELKPSVWSARPSWGSPNDITESHNRHYANLYRGCIQRASPAVHRTIFSIYIKIRSSHFTSLTVTFWGLSLEITVLCFREGRLILRHFWPSVSHFSQDHWPAGWGHGGACPQRISPRWPPCSACTRHTSHPSAWWPHAAESTGVSACVRSPTEGIWTSPPAPLTAWYWTPGRHSVYSFCWPRNAPPGAPSASLLLLWSDTQSAQSILSGLWGEQHKSHTCQEEQRDKSSNVQRPKSHWPLNLEGSVLGLRPVTWVYRVG